MAKNSAYRRGIRKESDRDWNSPALSEQLAPAEAGQLWGVSDSELKNLADQRVCMKICRNKEVG